MSEDEKLIDAPSHEELVKQLNEAELKANQHWERLLRFQAEADNAKRRAEKDIESAHKYALEKFVSELLPIIDGLELCESSVPPEMMEAAKPVVEGVHLTLKMFYSAMEKFGIVQVNPVGQDFNPELEQAISMQYDPDVKPGSVISCLQKGYTLNGRLLRPALVVVAKAE
jgi:molecular chaperone GrpE